MKPDGTVIDDEGPYKLVKRNDKFVVIKADNGKVVGTHATETKAKKQLAALHKNVKE